LRHNFGDKVDLVNSVNISVYIVSKENKSGKLTGLLRKGDVDGGKKILFQCVLKKGVNFVTILSTVRVDIIR